jgi:hypothetical protein
MASPARKSIFESPWYWLYLFATGALIALLLLGWKFGPRQAQIENKYLGHSAAESKAAGEAPEAAELSTSERTIIGLAPLYVVLGIVFVVAWIAVWRQLFLQKRAPPDDHGRSGGEHSAAELPHPVSRPQVKA